MSREVSFTVPMPSGAKLLNSNSRDHRMAAAKLTAMWRSAGREAASGLETFDGPVHILARIHKPRSGRWDPNNFWPTVKAIVDGVVDAGVLVDDDHEHVIGPDMRRGEKGLPRVVLSITELPPK
jgi:hypothetical protein